MSRIRIRLCLLCVVLCIGCKMSVYASTLEESELYAKSAVLIDADSKRVLFGKNENEVLAMASTTKIMTCIVALEQADIKELVDISSYAASMPKVKLGVRKGETYILEDLLYSLMLESHNDAAVAIAEHVGKKYLPEELRNKSVAEFTNAESKQAVAAFSVLMNGKAKELGCENTWFITPNGLDASEVINVDGEEITKEHSTTATELATIMSYCVLESPKKEEFLRITQSPHRYFSSQKGRGFACSNLNSFLTMMDGVISGKTGFTNKAGYCYVGALKRDDRIYVAVVLACGWPNNKGYKWSDTKKLMNYGIENYFYRRFEEVLYPAEKLGKVSVQNGQTEKIGQSAHLPVVILEREGNIGNIWEENEEIEGVLLHKDEEIDVICTMKEELSAPVRKGDEIGCIQYKIGDTVYKEEHIVLAVGLEAIDIKWCMQMVWKLFFAPFADAI